MYTFEAMNFRKAAAGPTLALAILAGCQGGDASDPIDASATIYKVKESYGGDEAHPKVASTTDPLAREAEIDLEMRVNAHRNALGLDGLRVLPELKEIALAHAVHMGRHEPFFFDHLSPEGDLPGDRAKGRVEFTAIGENIAAGQSAAEAVLRNWLDSPGHRANLEDPKWTHMGAGHALLPDSPYVTYWTLDLIQR
jgi:uncharacterized protein YkwD